MLYEKNTVLFFVSFSHGLSYICLQFGTYLCLLKVEFWKELKLFRAISDKR